MKKMIALAGTILLAVTLTLSAQSVEQVSFASMGDWVPGSGNWEVSGGRLLQTGLPAPLARIDRRTDQRGVYEIDFTIRYVDGGFYSEQELMNGEYHAGFGIQLGGTNPVLGGRSWGVGQSYLVWLNLDTRLSTLRNSPEHFGFRAQVYESRSNTSMSLLSGAAVEQQIGQPLASLDLFAALSEFGWSEDDLIAYLDSPVRVNVRVNTNTGEVGVLDPTAPIRYFMQLDPQILRGNYISLRTNNLSTSYANFTIRR
ncbi:MAG: hypothetical protein EA383_02270 [Spirochaetaceae bacterium]|nr:MAG: hypothetical protein EA383_02270 [Spirochaetaceae bacterium]